MMCDEESRRGAIMKVVKKDPQEGLVVLEVMYLHVPTCTSYR